METSFYEKNRYFCANCGSELEYHRIREDEEQYMALMHSKDAVSTNQEPCPLAGKVFDIPDDTVLELAEVKNAER